MFEDSLIESQHRIRTRSKSWAAASFAAQAMLVAALILMPLLQPQALPKQSLERLLVAPAAPSAPVRTLRTAAVHTAPQRTLQAALEAPGRIPHSISTAPESVPPGFSSISDFAGATPGLPNGILSAAAPPPVAVVRPAKPKGPVLVSSGVAAGQLLSPIQPRYPEIARDAHVQGTVVVEATISRQGAIENLRVSEGPPMLRQAAIDAIAAAHYRPFLLNGEPVEVQTTIRVIFSLGN